MENKELEWITGSIA